MLRKTVVGIVVMVVIVVVVDWLQTQEVVCDGG